MINRIDVTDIEGTYCYCSESSAAQIRQRIFALPLGAVHLLGTGDYHYLSLFFLERISEEFALVLFDNHPDDQPGAFDEGLLTCGSWVKTARESLPKMKADFLNSTDITPESIPIYLSIDLDVLSTRFAKTDWDQGDYSLDRLKDEILKALSGHKLIGVDICGGLKEPDNSGNELNKAAIEAICSIVSTMLL